MLLLNLLQMEKKKNEGALEGPKVTHLFGSYSHI